MHRIWRFMRGLVLGLTLSVLNLVGLFFMLLLLGGIGDWTRLQVAGVFGLFEVGTGLAFVFCPNIWRLPPIESVTPARVDARLTASTLFIPHWAGAAKALAGGIMMAVALVYEGAGFVSAGLVPLAAFIMLGTIGLSIAVARWGVARPDRDVVQIVVRRPGREELDLPPLSLTAAFIQVLIGMFALPAVKLIDPGAFFQPAFGPTPQVLLVVGLAVAAALAAALFAWRGRISWRAPVEQQREAEQVT